MLLLVLRSAITECRIFIMFLEHGRPLSSFQGVLVQNSKTVARKAKRASESGCDGQKELRVDNEADRAVT